MLFIDAHRMGHMPDRTHRELAGDDIRKIDRTYRAWCGDRKVGRYTDAPGFCKSMKLEETRKHNHALTPGRYVGAEPQQNDGESFEQKMSRLVEQWTEQAEVRRLDAVITENLERLGFSARG